MRAAWSLLLLTFGAHAADVQLCTIGTDRAAWVKGLAQVQGTANALRVGCATTAHVGSDPDQIIGFKSNTHVVFDPGGSLTLDSVGVSTFAIADVDNVVLDGLNILYDASPGTLLLKGPLAAGSAANGKQLKYIMAANGAKFVAGVTPIWTGPTNALALFWIHGDVSGIKFRHFTIRAKGTNAATFIPVVFALGQDYGRDGKVHLPEGVSFEQGTIDGAYMGIVGTAHATLIDGLTSERYSDLQGPNGESVGGVNNWFAPPHLIYLISAKGYPHSAAIYNVVDNGGAPIGNPVQRSNGSGTTLSLKLELNDSLVSNYTSNRTTGCVDLPAEGNSGPGVMKNISCTFDSSTDTAAGRGVWGWRWPGPQAYVNLTLANIDVTDTAGSPTQFPFLGANSANNSAISIKDLVVHQSQPVGFPGPNFKGQNVVVAGEFHWNACTRDQAAQAVSQLTGNVSVSCP